MVSISKLVDIIASISNKKISKKFVSGPEGVKGRNSDNKLIKQKLNWEPSLPLSKGLEKTYYWISDQLNK